VKEAKFNVTILEDSILEKKEIFTLMIEKPLHLGVSRDKDNHQAMVNIMDTTGK